MTFYKYYLENHVLGRKHIFEKFKDMDAPKRTLKSFDSVVTRTRKRVDSKERKWAFD